MKKINFIDEVAYKTFNINDKILYFAGLSFNPTLCKQEFNNTIKDLENFNINFLNKIKNEELIQEINKDGTYINKIYRNLKQSNRGHNISLSIEEINSNQHLKSIDQYCGYIYLSDLISLTNYKEVCKKINNNYIDFNSINDDSILELIKLIIINSIYKGMYLKNHQPVSTLDNNIINFFKKISLLKEITLNPKNYKYYKIIKKYQQKVNGYILDFKLIYNKGNNYQFDSISSLTGCNLFNSSSNEENVHYKDSTKLYDVFINQSKSKDFMEKFLTLTEVFSVNKEHFYLTGGSLISMVNDRPIKDFDIFSKKVEDIQKLINNFVELFFNTDQKNEINTLLVKDEKTGFYSIKINNESKIIEGAFPLVELNKSAGCEYILTENALTIKIISNNINEKDMNIQFVFKMIGQPEKLVSVFDYEHCKWFADFGKKILKFSYISFLTILNYTLIPSKTKINNVNSIFRFNTFKFRRNMFGSEFTLLYFLIKDNVLENQNTVMNGVFYEENKSTILIKLQQDFSEKNIYNVIKKINIDLMNSNIKNEEIKNKMDNNQVKKISINNVIFLKNCKQPNLYF